MLGILLLCSAAHSLLLDEKVVALARGREIAADYDSLDPILVSSPPAGVDFTNCITSPDSGHCCVDFVRSKSHFHSEVLKVCVGGGDQVGGVGACAGVHHQGGDGLPHQLRHSVRQHQGEDQS